MGGPLLAISLRNNPSRKGSESRPIPVNPLAKSAHLTPRTVYTTGSTCGTWSTDVHRAYREDLQTGMEEAYTGVYIPTRVQGRVYPGIYTSLLGSWEAFLLPFNTPERVLGGLSAPF